MNLVDKIKYDLESAKNQIILLELKIFQITQMEI